VSGVRIKAPAKVNLSLQIGARRDDGFHEIDTLFQAIELHDLLELSPRDEPGVELDVVGADLGAVEDNLVWRAASQTLARFSAGQGPVPGVQIRLTKHIPAGAGLGGGSSDAAAVIKGLHRLFERTFKGDQWVELASGLGSDVPFFVGQRALARGLGRGEVLRPLPALPTAHLVLGLPPVHCNTGQMYQALAASRHAASHTAASHQPASPSAAAGHSRRPSDLDQSEDWSVITRHATNDFEAIAVAQSPLIDAALQALRTAGASLAMLSGSGSAVFGVFANRAAAEHARAVASHQVPLVRFVTTTTLEQLPEAEVL
jgi:4-diphosphocytidyl-2-C-methyl-D-erythritol kinase